MAMIEAYRIGVELVLGGDLATGIEALIPGLVRLDGGLAQANVEAKALAAGLAGIAATAPGIGQAAAAMERLHAAMSTMSQAIEQRKSAGGTSTVDIPLVSPKDTGVLPKKGAGPARPVVDRRLPDVSSEPRGDTGRPSALPPVLNIQRMAGASDGAQGRSVSQPVMSAAAALAQTLQGNGAAISANGLLPWTRATSVPSRGEDAGTKPRGIGSVLPGFMENTLTLSRGVRDNVATPTLPLAEGRQPVAIGEGIPATARALSEAAAWQMRSPIADGATQDMDRMIPLLAPRRVVQPAVPSAEIAKGDTARASIASYRRLETRPARQPIPDLWLAIAPPASNLRTSAVPQTDPVGVPKTEVVAPSRSNVTRREDTASPDRMISGRAPGWNAFAASLGEIVRATSQTSPKGFPTTETAVPWVQPRSPIEPPSWRALPTGLQAAAPNERLPGVPAAARSGGTDALSELRSYHPRGDQPGPVIQHVTYLQLDERTIARAVTRQQLRMMGGQVSGTLRPDPSISPQYGAHLLEI